MNENIFELNGVQSIDFVIYNMDVGVLKGYLVMN